MGTNIKFRSATFADLPTLREFEQGVIAAERPFNANLKDDPIQYYDLESMLESADYEILVAETEDKIVASGYARLSESKEFFRHSLYVYLGFMFVLPDYRGHGISGELMQEMLAWGKAQGADEAKLDVYALNEAAIRAYEKAGFRPLLVNMTKNL